MKMTRACPILIALLLAACGGPDRQEPSTHATKYRTSGDCVEDAVTGLVWEAKSDSTGLHDWRNT